MIRILHVVSSLGTGSGVASVLMSYYRAIDRSKIQFDFLSFKNKEGSFEEEILSLGGKVYYCSAPSFSKKFKKEMNQFFAEHADEYQILHCHPIFATAMFSPFAKKYGITKIISHSHTTKYSDNKISAIRNFIILSLFGRKATHYMACSEEAKSIFYWKKKDDIFLLKNAVNVDKFKFSLAKREEMRHSLNIKDNETVVGHIGRFTASKNHRFILQIFGEYLKSNPHSKLLLLGDGDLFDEIVKEAEKAGLSDNVIFAGRNENVADYLSAMDVFLFPSTFEGLGIVLVEAQLNGLKCLASSNVPGAADITGNVKFESLNKDFRHWSNLLSEMEMDIEQRDKVKMINNELDINTCSKALEDYYFSIL